MRTYQDHEGDESSTSASHRKLERLKFPADLTGKTFLDIGCNEGFFLNRAVELGATRAVGIDRDQRRLDFCRERYPSPAIELHCQTWDTLPEGPFDLILLASSMHYEPDPAALLRRIAAQLAPGGLLILECGVSAGGNPSEREMVLVSRRARDLWYPTETFLLDVLLKPFSRRRVASPEKTSGDPVPRSVYHCSPWLPVVLLLRGMGGRYGKSSTARAFGVDATKVIHLDWFLGRLRNAAFQRTPLHEFLASKRDAPIFEVYREIDGHSLTDAYAELLAEAVSPSDEKVIIEGCMTDLQAQALARALSGKALLWDAQRRFEAGEPASLDQATQAAGRPVDNGGETRAPRAGRGRGLVRRAKRLARPQGSPPADREGAPPAAGGPTAAGARMSDAEAQRRAAISRKAREMASNQGHDWKELSDEERRRFRATAIRESPP